MSRVQVKSCSFFVRDGMNGDTVWRFSRKKALTKFKRVRSFWAHRHMNLVIQTSCFSQFWGVSSKHASFFVESRSFSLRCLWRLRGAGSPFCWERATKRSFMNLRVWQQVSESRFFDLCVHYAQKFKHLYRYWCMNVWTLCKIFVSPSTWMMEYWRFCKEDPCTMEVAWIQTLVASLTNFLYL